MSSGSFSFVFLFYLEFIAFMTQCTFSLSNLTCSLFLVCLLASFCLCLCMYLILSGFLFFFYCWIFSCVCICILEFSILPTIYHGKSKDGIQPFKGPKPAARIANSLENRVLRSLQGLAYLCPPHLPSHSTLPILAGPN